MIFLEWDIIISLKKVHKMYQTLVNATILACEKILTVCAIFNSLVYKGTLSNSDTF